VNAPDDKKPPHRVSPNTLARWNDEVSGDPSALEAFKARNNRMAPQEVIAQGDPIYAAILAHRHTTCLS
jgi:hypothetical protein